jgi:AhpC/TSA family
MKSLITTTLAGLLSLTVFAAEPGKPAPDFSGKTAKAGDVSLASLKGKVVVLEWVNYDCPFVKKHYSSGNLPKLQETYTAKGVVWITVNSAAEGKQGYLEPAKLIERSAKEGNKASHLLVDSAGTIGKAYGAKVTPHLYIINQQGVLAYNGAIDSKATTKTEDIDSADKLFANALDAVLAGKDVTHAKNQPYGCGVKY